MSNVVDFASRHRPLDPGLVPPVPVELLAEAAERLVSFREEYGPDRWDVSSAVGMTIRGLRGAKTIEELCDLVDCLSPRFSALLNHLADWGYPKERISLVLHGKDWPMLQAAARAPLAEMGFSECRFDPAIFLRIVKEEREAKATDRAADS